MESEELVAIHTGHDRIPLGESGDSGAWVINASGQLVGQQIAVKSDHESRELFTVISPIQGVFRDIERATKGKLEFPLMREKDGHYSTQCWSLDA
jgi:hypothetical protein